MLSHQLLSHPTRQALVPQCRDRAEAQKVRRTCKVTIIRAGPHLLLFPLQHTGELPGWESRARAVLGARSASQIGRWEAEWSGWKGVFRGQLQPGAKTSIQQVFTKKIRWGCPAKLAVQQGQEGGQGLQFVPKEARVRWSMLDIRVVWRLPAVHLI